MMSHSFSFMTIFTSPLRTWFLQHILDSANYSCWKLVTHMEINAARRGWRRGLWARSWIEVGRHKKIKFTHYEAQCVQSPFLVLHNTWTNQRAPNEVFGHLREKPRMVDWLQTYLINSSYNRLLLQQQLVMSSSRLLKVQWEIPILRIGNPLPHFTVLIIFKF